LGRIIVLVFVTVLLPFCVFGISDTTPPQLAALSFQSTVDVSSGPRTISVNATITDDLSGVSLVFSPRLQFTSPSGQQVFGIFNFVAGSSTNGTYQANVPFPLYVEAGVWTTSFRAFDVAGNQISLGPSMLHSLGFPSEITVVDARPDTSPPTLLGAEFSPNSVDVSSADATVTLSLNISDNLSGVSFFVPPPFLFFAAAIAPPTTSSSNARRYVISFDFHLLSGTNLDGRWQTSLLIPRYSPAGPWHLEFVTLYDALGNTITLDTNQLEAAGINPVLAVTSSVSDVSPPKLTGLTLSPSVIDTSVEPQLVTFTLSASDNLSGLDFTPQIFGPSELSLTSPSGNQRVDVDSFLTNLVGGTPLAGTWQMTAIWPQFSEEGTWQIALLNIKDAVGNQATFTPAMLQALGLPNAVVVVKPSQDVDGTVGSTGGTVEDSSFGSRAEIKFPAGIVSTVTNVSIDVFSSPPAVPTPEGFTSPGTYFVNLAFSPSLSEPIRFPGITLVLPLLTSMTPGAHLSLYHIDSVTGTLAPAMDAFHHAVVGTVDSGGQSATFLNVVTASTVVAFISDGSVLGDVNGDGSVTCADVSLAQASFGKHAGQPGFNAAADLNNDHVVDIKDFFIVTHQLPAGTKCR